MAHDVHLHVSFPADENDGVAALAAKHLPELRAIERDRYEDFDQDAVFFLEALAQRSGRNSGSKGGLSLWGQVGNYCDGERFVKALIPFWTELLGGVEGGPLDFEHVVIFEEHEQTDQAIAYEIYLADVETVGRTLIVKRHELPFCWAQA